MQVSASQAPLSPLTDLSSRFAASLAALGPFEPKPHLVVALSGGADSMAMAILADAWVRAHHGTLTTLTIDHGLRPESRSEAEFVAASMLQQNIAHHILTPEHRTLSNNLQANARQWRYDALAEWCRAHGMLHCLVAHHAGDQRETVAHNQARGESADGPSGMGQMREYRGVRFLRPLLGVEKAELMEYLRTCAVRWVEDPSNNNPQFARVRTREALQQNVALQQELSALALREGEARAERDNHLATEAAKLVTLSPAGFAEFPITGWKKLPRALAMQFLADLLTSISGATQRPRQPDTERFYEALRAPSFSRRTLHGCEIELRKETVRMAREAGRVEAPVTLSGKGSLFWDQRFWVHYDVPVARPLTLQALDNRRKGGLPNATPSLWHLDERVFVPHMEGATYDSAPNTRVTIGFAPVKPLAAAPFWWLNTR